jgi:predicted DCC family thiol-disulfide oxidoreductase YuxK
MGEPDHPIVLFDGVCKFCNAGVNFLLDRDSRARLRFATLQSPAGQALLEKFGLPTRHFDTFALIQGERCFTRSTAALRVAWLLDPPWCWLYPLLLVPPFLRDWVYTLIARNRYRWFGKLDACRVPSPEVRSRFLD